MREEGVALVRKFDGEFSDKYFDDIGDHIDDNGLAEVWVGSGLLGPGPTELVFQGKAYNNGL